MYPHAEKITASSDTLLAAWQLRDSELGRDQRSRATSDARADMDLRLWVALDARHGAMLPRTPCKRGWADGGGIDDAR
ncbi:hypothetical protein VTO73DRAFT_13093 [Trametes versicolor]